MRRWCLAGLLGGEGDAGPEEPGDRLERLPHEIVGLVRREGDPATWALPFGDVHGEAAAP